MYGRLNFWYGDIPSILCNMTYCMFPAGVIDDRGKFISITPEELNSVAHFMRQRGRVSITELAQASNSLINLMPESHSTAWWNNHNICVKTPLLLYWCYYLLFFIVTSPLSTPLFTSRCQTLHRSGLIRQLGKKLLGKKIHQMHFSVFLYQMGENVITSSSCKTKCHVCLASTRDDLKRRHSQQSLPVLVSPHQETGNQQQVQSLLNPMREVNMSTYYGRFLCHIVTEVNIWSVFHKLHFFWTFWQ